MVFISGSKARSMVVSSSLSLSVSAYVNKCGGKTSTAGLTYAWKVIDGNSEEIQSSIVSVLKDVTKFKTMPNVFVAGKNYKVVATVTDIISGVSSDDSVSIIVSASPLIPKINPSSAVMLIRAGTSFSVDGKSSYDPDNIVDNSKKLLHSWSCVSANVGSCPLTLVSMGTDSSMWSASESAVNTTARIVLTLMDSATSGRNASTFMVIKVIEGDRPRCHYRDRSISSSESQYPR
jgi:hypothetical protein